MIVKSSEGRVSGLISKVETAGERVYRRLRNDIIFGRLAPAQKLKLEALKELLRHQHQYTAGVA